MALGFVAHDGPSLGGASKTGSLFSRFICYSLQRPACV